MDKPNDDADSSPRWRRAASTMIYVNNAYRRLPPPAKAVLWLVPAVVARLLDLPFPPWW